MLAMLPALPSSAGDSPRSLTARIVDATPQPRSANPANEAPANRLPPSAHPPVPARVVQGLRYYTVAELDVRPQVATHVMPDYPADVFSGTRGRVVLRILIGVDGAVDDATVVAARPPGLFEPAATRAFAAARFTPGQIRGKPVPSQLVIEVTFGD